jgi:ribosomal protein S18 acetylase RimI-like enzyme
MIEGGTQIGTEDALQQIAQLLNRNNSLTVQYEVLPSPDKDDILYETLFGEVVAAVTSEWPLLPKRGFVKIKHLVVHENFRRMGFGKRILNRVLTNCQKSAIMYASVRADNLPSLNLFKSIGFEEADITDGNTGPVILLVNMRKIEELQKWNETKLK